MGPRNGAQVAAARRHVISEDLRTVAACEALEKGRSGRSGPAHGRGAHQLQQGLRGQLRRGRPMVELAQDLPGLIGARLTGGGFGGCTINLVEQSEAKAFAAAGQALCRQNRHRARDSHLPRLGGRSPAGVVFSANYDASQQGTSGRKSFHKKGLAPGFLCADEIQQSQSSGISQSGSAVDGGTRAFGFPGAFLDKIKGSLP
jgi:hypothetical protein